MDAMGRPCLICQPSSRTGENPPYGMIGGMVETSASFEARYAPLSTRLPGRSATDRPYRDPTFAADLSMNSYPPSKPFSRAKNLSAPDVLRSG